MINLTIDGKALTAEEGKTILQVAKGSGIDIPTLCYHPALEPFGACRLCIVEIISKGRKRLVTSCNYPVEEGLEVHAASEDVLETRKWILETLLAKCPNVEIIKRLAYDYGIERPRFKLEDGSCILCGLCVRICEERMGRSAINFVGRGIDRKIDTPFHIQTEECMACGACAFVCPTGAIKLEDITKYKPISILSEFNQGLIERSPIYVPYPQAVPNIPVIDRDKCVHFLTGKCGICQEVCSAGAINYEQKDEIIEIDVGSIILAPGFDEFDAKLIYEYGYSRFPNVITSIEFERILSASGPYLGKIQRLSDGKAPKKIAFIQCVGSRDLMNGNSYCSSVCCMYAVKESVVAKEHDPSLEISIFGMDMRAQGKGFDTYFERAEKEQGIRFVRAKVFSVEEIPETNDLRLKYVADDGKMREEIFSLVVLSVGLEPSQGSKELAKKLGLGIDEYGFCRSREFSPLETTKPGIFVTGAFQGPKDIPETVAQASGAMVKSAGLLSEVRGTLVKKKEYPPERDVKGEEPRIGVFVCHCGINIGGVVNVSEVKDYAKTLDGVVYVGDNLYTCSQDTQEKIREVIKEHNLNRIVVAACSPRTHEPLFQETMREAKLNRHLFEMANIRDQCSWVHQHEPEKATQKAKELLKMKVAKARLIQPLKEIEIPVHNRALVIGGGIAGMNAALEIANQGFDCYLVEKDKELGGNLKNLYSSIEGGNVQEFLQDTIKKVKENELIHVYTDTEIKDVSGYVGNFSATLRNGKGSEQLELGAIIVATGGGEYKPTEYMYGEDERVCTQLELEEKLAKNPLSIKGWKNVVMIQCVGSRNGDHPYCSKICCSQAIKNALKLKEANPSLDIYILYQDIRTYGFLEEYYSQARAKGVVFLRYEHGKNPQVTREDGKIKVRIFDPIVGEDLVLDPDGLVLSVAIVPTPNEDLAKLLKVPLTTEGFFLEAHAKLRPVEFATDGIFLCGMAHFPKPIPESISQSSGAAGKASILLSKGLVRVEPIISWVDEEKCIGCGLCEVICPYKAIQLKDAAAGKRAETIPASCKGCGLCGASCPQRAITNYHFTEDQLLAEINALAV